MKNLVGNKIENKYNTIKIVGESVGDSSVGIGSAHFEIDTGIYELSKEDKEFIVKNMVRAIWELHDNGDLKFDFTDEMEEDDYDYRRRFSNEDAELKLCDKCRIILNL